MLFRAGQTHNAALDTHAHRHTLVDHGRMLQFLLEEEEEAAVGRRLVGWAAVVQWRAGESVRLTSCEHGEGAGSSQWGCGDCPREWRRQWWIGRHWGLVCIRG